MYIYFNVRKIWKSNIKFHLISTSYIENSLLVLLWFNTATIPPRCSLNTTLGPIPHPNSMPVLYLSLSNELTPVSIFVKTKELSFEEQLNINGPQGFIYLSMVTSSMIELELTTSVLPASPVLTLNTLICPIFKQTKYHFLWLQKSDPTLAMRVAIDKQVNHQVQIFQEQLNQQPLNK